MAKIAHNHFDSLYKTIEKFYELSPAVLVENFYCSYSLLRIYCRLNQPGPSTSDIK